MTSPSENQFVVDRLAIVDQQVERIIDAADTIVERQKRISILTHAVAELRTRPMEFGDPLFNTVKARGLVCYRMITPIIIHFVVYPNERAVCILSVSTTPRESD